MMKTAMTADAIGRLNASPPSPTGLSRKSPTDRSKRSRENKGGPEQHDPRNIRPEISGGQ